MGDTKNTIEINGVRYDASTGKMLGEAKPAKAPTGVSMDGVVRAKPRVRPTHTPAKTSTAHHKKVTKAKTLKRTGLKKPTLRSNDAVRNNLVIGSVVSKNRFRRASTTSKSQKISRFANTDVSIKNNAPAKTEKSPHKIKPAKQGLAKKENSIEQFEKAIEEASTHLNKYVSKKKRKVFKSKKINALAGTLAVLLIVGFFGYQNAGHIEMKVASTKAGFSAHLPGYSPAGFAMNGPIQSEPGKVAVSFKSHADDRQYKLTQVASNWSSETLADQLKDKADKQVWQEQGKTIYTYDNSNASWVDGGILYEIEGNSELNTDQLRRIVNSL